MTGTRATPSLQLQEVLATRGLAGVKPCPLGTLERPEGGADNTQGLELGNLSFASQF